MPNWCMTEYVIRNSNEDVLTELAEGFSQARKVKDVKSDFGEEWLGNVVEYLKQNGVEIQTDNTKGMVECTPEIDFDEETNMNELHIFSETAWEPIPVPVLKMIDKFAPKSETILYLWVGVFDLGN